MENDLEKIYDGFLYGIGFMGSLSLFAFEVLLDICFFLKLLRTRNQNILF